MRSRAINRYKSVQVTTASPGNILVMLYDGLLRFLREGETAMEEKNFARAGDRIDRAMAIISELCATLRHEEAEELCAYLEGIYLFSMDHLVQANIERSPAKIAEVIKILEPLQDAWRQAVHGGPEVSSEKVAS